MVFPERPPEMPPAMPMAQMKALCLDVDAEGTAPYPEVEDREEIEPGEFFLVTVPLEKDDEEEKHQWVLPAQATKLSDGTLEMKRVGPVWVQGDYLCQGGRRFANKARNCGRSRQR